MFDIKKITIITLLNTVDSQEKLDNEEILIFRTIDFSWRDRNLKSKCLNLSEIYLTYNKICEYFGKLKIYINY